MSRLDLRGRTLTAAQLRAVLPRGGVDVDSVVPTVRPIVDDVAARGAVAALEYGEKFDGARPNSVRVPIAELASALARLDPDVRAALEVAIERTRAVHADQRRTDTTQCPDPELYFVECQWHWTFQNRKPPARCENRLQAQSCMVG